MKHTIIPVGTDGELAACTVCGGAEVELTIHCPGRKMTDNQKREVSRGHTNFKDGKWFNPARKLAEKSPSIKEALDDAAMLTALVRAGRTSKEPGVLTEAQANEQFRKKHGINLFVPKKKDGPSLKLKNVLTGVLRDYTKGQHDSQCRKTLHGEKYECNCPLSLLE
jgi:hypothetical protein